ncbi:hypothetical protein AAHH67_31490 [Niallia circulans]
MIPLLVDLEHPPFEIPNVIIVAVIIIHPLTIIANLCDIIAFNISNNI